MHPLRSRLGDSRAPRTRTGATAPAVPGLTLCRALRASGGGPPWRARQTATGYDVVLRPLPAGVTPRDFESLPDHPHLAVPTVAAGSDGCSYAVTRHAAHGGLDALLERRGALAPGEVSTLVLAVGRALAAMHAAGRAHGSVTAAAVLLDTGLRPQLDASLCRPAGRSAVPSATLQAEDVRALGALAITLLGSEPRPELRACLSAAADRDPDLRPQATELVRLVVAAEPPEALRLTTEVDRTIAPAPRTLPRRRHGGDRPTPRWPPVALAALAAIVLLALAVVAGAAWARVSDSSDTVPQALHRPAPAERVRASHVAGPDWGRVVDDLDTTRAAAFANAAEETLAFVDEPGSAALGRDAAAVRALAGRGLQASGFRIAVLSVTVVSADAVTAVLDVADQRSAYDLVDAAGSVVATQPARAPRHWRVELVRLRGTWLVRDVR